MNRGDILKRYRTMNERKLEIAGTLIVCILAGIFGAMVGFKMESIGNGWPHDEFVSDCIKVGCIIGLGGTIVTSFFMLAAVREKAWLVALVGCILTFGAACWYEGKAMTDLYGNAKLQFEREQRSR